VGGAVDIDTGFVRSASEFVVREGAQLIERLASKMQASEHLYICSPVDEIWVQPFR
jgi:hypothetical protein